MVPELATVVNPLRPDSSRMMPPGPSSGSACTAIVPPAQEIPANSTNGSSIVVSAPGVEIQANQP